MSIISVRTGAKNNTPNSNGPKRIKISNILFIENIYQISLQLVKLNNILNFSAIEVFMRIINGQLTNLLIKKCQLFPGSSVGRANGC